jgi:hypothetical protein
MQKLAVRGRQICGEVETRTIAWYERQLAFSEDREEFREG